MTEEFEFPSNEQMLADLEGKVPDWQMQTLKDGLAFVERLESMQLSRILKNYPPVGGTFEVKKPPRYLSKDD